MKPLSLTIYLLYVFGDLLDGVVVFLIKIKKQCLFRLILYMMSD